ncbi:hypothetical protein CFOL_v3_07693 [Cephalotus follicularis]|uniref:PUM-HD domain-containing protein n=1 Tax=Cephalotus follicularis TaxID=3775 RepID=A0A1Q3B8F3_CEPFO|nr:hypothetical protein CFOL_v3_07693 [Cephalotus follicularis]
MAAKDQQSKKPKSTKRKQVSGSKPDPHTSTSKKPKLAPSKPHAPHNKSFKSPQQQQQQQHRKPFQPRSANSQLVSEKPLTKRERRLHAKEVTEARKKKRRPHYNLEQELASLWEKMRRRNISKEDRSKLVSEALQKMKGKIPEIAGSHVSSRVLQTCVKSCSPTERDAVFEELQPHFLNLACNVYAVHLLKKMLDSASKKQLAGFLSSLHGHVAPLLRHMVGSVVIEHAYELGNATQKQELIMELYSTELQLFKDLVSMKENRLVDIISKLGLQKNSVLRHMASVIQPILEKGIVDHSIIHKLLMEYFSIADKSSAADVIQQLSGPLLVRMIHTKDGSSVGMLCLKHGSAKERKKIIKGMKTHIEKIARDQYGSMVLVCIVSTVDDTKLITKIVIRELQKTLKELVLDKSGRRLLLQLLHPNYSRYFSPDDLASLNIFIPSLGAKSMKDEESSEKEAMKDEESSEKDAKSDLEVAVHESDLQVTVSDTDKNLSDCSKKDPFLRRQELLVDSGLGESLVDICIENAGELLRSNFGKEVIYEVAIGGSGGILYPTLADKLKALHEAVASLAAKSKSEESEEEHVLVNFHSSRVIRKLILDCPTFASTLWKAMEGKCDEWAQGHSHKVISAFLESSDLKVQERAKEELQPLIDSGVLKIFKIKQPVGEV